MPGQNAWTKCLHGIKTKDEAEALWKEAGKEYIWFLMETVDHFESVIYGSSHRDSDEPGTDQFVKQDQMFSIFRRHCNPAMERRNPDELGQLARATIFDNLNKCNSSSKTSCCDRIWKLMMKIDQLEIPVSEKLMMKKLIPGAQTFRSFPGNNH